LSAEDRQAAQNDGKCLGRELAKAGFGITVYFSNEESLEPHVVSGYVEARNNDSKIHVRHAQSQRGKVAFKEEKYHQDLFNYSIFPGDDWEIPFYTSLVKEEEIDAVVLMAGGTSTLIAGQIAVARRLPLLVVDKFGGSAEKIWHQLAALNGQKKSWRIEKAGELVQELKRECIKRKQ